MDIALHAAGHAAHVQVDDRSKLAIQHKRSAINCKSLQSLHVDLLG
jgi:hypothetical protein